MRMVNFAPFETMDPLRINSNQVQLLKQRCWPRESATFTLNIAYRLPLILLTDQHHTSYHSRCIIADKRLGWSLHPAAVAHTGSMTQLRDGNDCRPASVCCVEALHERQIVCGRPRIARNHQHLKKGCPKACKARCLFVSDIKPGSKLARVHMSAYEAGLLLVRERNGTRFCV